MVRKGLSGKQKAANFLIFLGPEKSAKIFKHLNESEIEELTLEIANVRKITGDRVDDVFREFYEMALANQYIAQGGIEYAKELLEKALGPQKAVEILSRISASLQVRPFDFARKTEPAQLLNFIQAEHPQTIALVLAYLEPEKASIILSALPPDKQSDVARRIALMDTTSPDAIKEVERVLERKLSSVIPHEVTSAGGVKSLVEILNRVDRATEKTILEALEVQDPELAEEVKRLMFVFEDIVTMDDRSVQRVLREVESHDLALALKGASDEVATKIFNNMSKRAGEMLREDIQFMGPVRLRDVEEAQQRIVNIIRKLEDAGEIVIARGGGDEIIV
ncbi:MAG TPA: flagellar motor switch protein FliG [Syntrophothermus lipocalidus]|uniref:Flagellar motor switch protein FliG n=1 Tax=Syntrophothermus lipocalidus (strain DSM 12680 / TGB-C1) TaxID=643648 RepID=D7CLZ8_SYNLT|nr:flagellar motor switch protein FliG [Syntrophothermus lipocalidus]ADI01733.1 flagellar motor switch protein FliG [Syntrophothermus lipocalidus DSM 12680]HHV77131.1 flagellar motor switch protein FliG [Syntrophothermus lipocalidus]HOV66232.1 flagellar motor switch protein FliG [Bacillota bacterium]